MFSSKDDDDNLFSGIASSTGSGLFPSRFTTDSNKAGSLFSSEVPKSSTGLFGLSASKYPASDDAHFHTSPSFTDLDKPAIALDSNATHLPAIKLSRLPAGLNRKGWLQKFFERFGTVDRVIPQPSLDVAYVVYETAGAVQRAKRLAHDLPPPPLDLLPSTVLINSVKCRIRARVSTDEHNSDHSSIEGPTSPEPPMCFTRRERFSQSGTTVEERANLLSATYKEERARLSVQFGESSGLLDMFDSEDFSDIRFTAIRGSCPDMCPELERYSREVHHRVSVFECLSSSLNSGSGWQMDHTRAVKDYERSSADQPVPLARELRPTPVLERTMAYLLASIADRPELDTTRSLWKPWYEFMWTRTRAIRKDVVQQRLCSHQIVGVMERIARFHVFCAARLVDQPIDSFDPRINSENLTQCLQTLKEMYNDLTDSSGVADAMICPNEAEFRAYMLLMKLNDEGALNDVQKLPGRLLRSAEVRFAVNVHQALTTHNFIRFFRLVRLANCLAACLLHRYFVQVRSQALVRLASSFTGHPRRDIQYPLSTLVRQLGFEDTMEAKSFCECWSLSIAHDCVIFEKQTPPQPPELAWRDGRAIRLVEEKRAGLALSTLFNKGSLREEDAIPHPVHSSFDNTGRFISYSEDDPLERTSVNVDTSVTDFGALPFKRSMFVTPTVQTKPLDSYLTEVLNDRQGLIQFINEWINDMLDIYPIAKNMLVGEFVASEIVTELVDDAIHNELHQLVVKYVQQRYESNLSDLSFHLSDTIINAVVKEECLSVVQYSFHLIQIVLELLNEDILLDLMKTVAYGCWLHAHADLMYSHSLLQSHFRKLRNYSQKKRRVKLEHNMIRSMPACPSQHLSALSLVAGDFEVDVSRVNGTESSLSVVTSKYRLLRTKRQRFSPWAKQVDEEFTWIAVPNKSYIPPESIGIYFADNDRSHRTATSVLVAWLRVKLINFKPIIIPYTSRHSYFSLVAAIICLGYPDELFGHLMLTSRVIPVLAIILDRFTRGNPPQAARQQPFHCLILPAGPDDPFEPLPCWSSLLHTGLAWIETELTERMPCSSSHKSPLPGRQMLGFKPCLGDLVYRFVDLKFLKPLALLSDHWNRRGLIHPSLDSVFNVYQSVVEELVNVLPVVCRADVLSSLTVPLDGITHLTNVTSWQSLISQWLAFTENVSMAPSCVQQAQNAIRRAEDVFQRRCGLDDSFPLPTLTPWLTLCILTVKDRLDQLTNSDLGSTLFELLGLNLKFFHSFDCDTTMVASQMALHFSTVGQPSMTYLSALHKSVEASRQQAVKKQLNHSIHSCNLHSTDVPDQMESRILVQLRNLDKKIDVLECSVSDVLMESGNESRLTFKSPTCSQGQLDI